MIQDLSILVGEELSATPPAPVAGMAAELARRFEGALAVLFYGSVLRTGQLDGVLDFYVLTKAPRRGLRGLLGRMLWPDVSYHEWEADGVVLRAKVASMTLAQFAGAVSGRTIDTTIWTRFVQPALLAWVVDEAVARKVASAVTAAAVTAARFAAALGPERGRPEAFWRALFRQTYAAEFRVEPSGRESSILATDPARYDRVLSAAWRMGGLAFDAAPDGELVPRLGTAERAGTWRAWRLRRRLGKPLNLARLAKAAFTFEGAARYAAWKIERHTGVQIPLTPWRERHPLLASPGVLWRLWRARRSA